MILTSDLICGFHEIDAQHRGLLDLAEAALLAAKAGDLAGTRQALTSLGDAIMGLWGAPVKRPAISLDPASASGMNARPARTL